MHLGECPQSARRRTGGVSQGSFASAHSGEGFCSDAIESQNPLLEQDSEQAVQLNCQQVLSIAWRRDFHADPKFCQARCCQLQGS
jgi:hypothetical protein